MLPSLLQGSSGHRGWAQLLQLGWVGQAPGLGCIPALGPVLLGGRALCALQGNACVNAGMGVLALVLGALGGC